MKIISKNYPNIEATRIIWNKFETEIHIEFGESFDFDEEEQRKYFQQMEEKIQWIEENRDLILNTFIEDEGMFYGLNDEIENDIFKKGVAQYYNGLVFEKPLTKEEFKEAIGIRYLSFYIDKERVHCDFDLDAEPNYFFGHLANIELYGDEIIMGGING